MKIGLMDDLLTGRVRVTPLLESVQQPVGQTGPDMPQRPHLCETLTAEFKSDRYKLPERDLIEALICLINAELVEA